MIHVNKCVISPKASAVLSKDNLKNALSRHLNGDWGFVNENTKLLNDLARYELGRLYSKFDYHGVNGELVTVVVFTDDSHDYTRIGLEQEIRIY